LYGAFVWCLSVCLASFSLSHFFLIYFLLCLFLSLPLSFYCSTKIDN
jgi:hypothetical protein